MRAKSNLETLEALPSNVRVVKTYGAGYSLIECHHPVDRHVYLSRYIPGGTRHWQMCGVCGGDNATTRDFVLPVKRLVILAKEIEAAQDSLF